MPAFQMVLEGRHFLFLSVQIYQDMNIAIVLLLSVCALVSTVCKLRRNRMHKGLPDRKTRYSPCFMFMAGLLAGVDAFVTGADLSASSIILDLMPSVMGLWVAGSSFSDMKRMNLLFGLLLASGAFVLLFHILRFSGAAGLGKDSGLPAMIDVAFLAMPAVLMIGTAARLYDVKYIIKNGTVWAFVSLAVDFVYMTVVMIALHFGGLPGLLLTGGAFVALSVRIHTDSLFVFWKRQERLITESMKVPVVSGSADVSHSEEVYKDLYERILDYFENGRPYLDGDLSINDLARDLYSNRLYISKAISQFTGRNFCQFVNYYRVRHSMSVFRDNPELKVHEIGSASGFNSIVSYNMAFRLFMGENPSDWCRKEKSRLLREKK